MVCCKWRSRDSSRCTRWLGVLSEIVGVFYRIFMRVLGPLMFITANLLIGSVAGLFFWYFYPTFYSDSPLLYIVHVVIGFYLVVNIFFNYFSCAFTPPGSPSYCPDPGRILGEKVSIIDGRKIYQFSYQLQIAPYVSYRYCHTCKSIKPPRAHHCNVTAKCVYNMDHYCPWMSNCVGFYNYRYFCLFLLFLQLACWYALALIGWHLVTLHPDPHSWIKFSMRMKTNIFLTHNLSAATYCFSLAISAAISSGVLLIWHIYLCLTNQTTIEFYSNMSNRADASANGQTYRNPFDEGWRKNLKRIFGYVPWYRNLWPSFHPPADPKYPFELEQRGLIEQLNV